MRSFVIPLSILVWGCAPATESTTSGYIYIRGKWQPLDEADREAGVASVPYCVVNPQDVAPEFLEEVLGHVEQSYNGLGLPLEIYRPSRDRTLRYAPRGEACRPEEASALMIRILFKKEMDWSQGRVRVPGMSHIGPRSTPIDSASGATMFFNIDRSGGWPGDSTQLTAARRRMHHTALHEFAHALGLAHEHQRLDAPGCDGAPLEYRDTPEIEAYFGHQRHGAYDPFSITNYCYEAQSPSIGDVAALRAIYGEFATQ